VDRLAAWQARTGTAERSRCVVWPSTTTYTAVGATNSRFGESSSKSLDQLCTCTPVITVGGRQGGCTIVQGECTVD
jgi:hypothetical protein